MAKKLWFAEKFVSLLIEQHLLPAPRHAHLGCDLLKNSYLCLLNNTARTTCTCSSIVVICWKIRIFAYWTTPIAVRVDTVFPLWFAEKFVSLLIEQHHRARREAPPAGCDLLKNSYLCLLNNTRRRRRPPSRGVVICWKIRIFAYWTTPGLGKGRGLEVLWFAEKFVSLLIEQHPTRSSVMRIWCCDLLKNSYLCLLNNTTSVMLVMNCGVVICWKIRIFAYWTTPFRFVKQVPCQLWFAEKFVSLLIEQHPRDSLGSWHGGCDLLKNSYLCLLNNTELPESSSAVGVVICWKIRIFAYWTTPRN